MRYKCTICGTMRDDYTTCYGCDWLATRPRMFGTRARINGLRSRHGRPELSVDEYVAARDAYYARHPDAVPQSDPDKAVGTR